jgi:hypothetical protein
MSKGQAVGKAFNDFFADQAGGYVPGGGALAGAAQGAANRNTRLANEQKDAINTAHANAMMLHEQTLAHKLGEDQLKEATASGQGAFDMLTSGPFAGEVLAQGKNSDDLNKMIKTGQLDPSKDTAFLTGRVPAGVDANGQPMFRSTYSVVRLGGPVEIDAKNAKFINDNLGMHIQGSSTDDKGVKTQGQSLSAAQANLLYQRAQSAQVVNAQRDIALKEAGLKKEDLEEHEAADKLATEPYMAQALQRNNASKPGHPDQYVMVKTYNDLISQPGFLAEHPTFPKEFALFAAGSQENFQKNFLDPYNKAQEKSQGVIGETLGWTSEKVAANPAGAAAVSKQVIDDNSMNADGTPLYSPEQKQQAAKMYKEATETMLQQQTNAGAKTAAEEKARKNVQQGGTNGSTEVGDKFLATLPPGRAAEIRGVVNGQVELSSSMMRTKDGQALLQDIFQYDDMFDGSKAPSYFTMRKDFTSGKTATTINSSNTVLHHFNLMENALEAGATAGKTGQAEAGLGMNDAGRTLNNSSLVIANELGKLYSGGVVTEGELHEWEAKLNPYGLGQTNSKLKKNIKDFTQLLGGKLEAWQDQWDDGVPSPNIQAAKKIASQESKDFYKRITGEDMRVHDVQPGIWDNRKSVINQREAPAQSQAEQQQEAQQQQQQTHGALNPTPKPPNPDATMKVPGADGVMHWTNKSGTVDYGPVNH